MAAEDLRDGEHEVRRGRSFGQLAVQLKADDLRRDHIDRLAEHARLGLDSADAPSDDAEPVDHRRVASRCRRANPGTRSRRASDDDLREVFEVDLVHDADRRRNDLEILERLLAPLEELVALAVALEFLFDVVQQRERVGVFVDLHAVVDDEIDRHERIDLLRIAAGALHRGAHRGEVDDARARR